MTLTMCRTKLAAGLPWVVSFACGLSLACATRPPADGAPKTSAPPASEVAVMDAASPPNSAPDPAPVLAPDPAPTQESLLVPPTSPPESVEQREARAVCEQYRQAAEARDVAALLELASKDYLDDDGTADPSDDIDHAGLERFLRGPFQAVTDVHYVFEYERIEWQGDTVTVDYHYLGSYRIRGIERRVEDTNRLVLKREGGGLKIVSGM